MHGLIFAELKKFVVHKYGGDAWNRIVAKAGMGDKVFLPNQTYGDHEMLALVGAAEAVSGKSSQQIQMEFGEFAAPELIKLYRAQINPAWHALDLIERTEEIIHRIVRLQIPGAQPPHLKSSRPGPKKVVIEYSSPRRMCGVAMGLAKGVGTHYHEPLSVTQSSCMLQGDPVCTIEVQPA